MKPISRSLSGCIAVAMSLLVLGACTEEKNAVSRPRLLSLDAASVTDLKRLTRAGAEETAHAMPAQFDLLRDCLDESIDCPSSDRNAARID